jgi:hypothetical protein
MSLKPIKLYVEALEKLEQARTLEESLTIGSMSLFLTEDVEGAVAALNKAADEASKEIDALGKLIQNAGLKNTAQALGKAKQAVAEIRLDPKSISDMLGLKDPAKESGKVLSNISALQGIIVNAAQTVVGALGDLGIENVEVPIRQALKEKASADPDAGVPDEDKFKAGVEKAWQPPAGMMNALKGFASGLGIGGGADYYGLTFDAFAEDILESNLGSMQELAKSQEFKDAAEAEEAEALSQELEKQGATEDAFSGEGGGATDGGTTDGGTTDEVAKKWSELTKAYLSSIKDKAIGQKYLDALKADKKFIDAVAGLVNLEESFSSRSLLGLLTEEIEFDVIKVPAAKVVKEEDTQVQLAIGLAKVLADQGVDVKNVPATEETSGDEPKPAGEKEAAKEQDNAEAELRAAAQAEAGEAQTPASAVLGAVDGWYDGLSDTSQLSMQAKNRIGGLKDALQGSLDNLSKVVEKEVSKAIGAWRKEHEETLTLSNRFAKKNFDQLQTLIPKLAATMLKKSNESNSPLTRTTIHKSVHKFLDKQFRYTNGNLLTEELLTSTRRSRSIEEKETDYAKSDMVKYRWMQMAGLGRYN